MNGTSEGVAEDREILEVDLFLKILRAGGQEHAASAENGGNQIRERLAGAGAGFDQQHAAVFKVDGHRLGHLALRGPDFECGQRLREAAGIENTSPADAVRVRDGV